MNKWAGRWGAVALVAVVSMMAMAVGVQPSASAPGGAIAAAAGDLDLGWSGDGVLPYSSRYSVALGPYGAGAAYVGSWKTTDGNGPMRVSKFTATGDPAPGWGSAGYVLRSFQPGGTTVSFPIRAARAMNGSRCTTC